MADMPYVTVPPSTRASGRADSGVAPTAPLAPLRSACSLRSFAAPLLRSPRGRSGRSSLCSAVASGIPRSVGSAV
jgi:hypothetical protein